MVWVRSEYAGELAVLSAWLSALLPWNVTYSPNVAGGSLLFVRFPFFQIRYAWGVPLAEGIAVFDPYSAIRFQSGTSLEFAYTVWAAGAVVVGLAVLLAVAYYTREAQVESAPVDPVRVMGLLLVLSGAVLSYATYLVARVLPGVPLPVGIVFLFALGGTLLRVDRR